MASVSASALEDIKQAAIPVHQSLYSLEAMWKAFRHEMPKCYRDAMDEILKVHHNRLGNFRGCMLECLPIDPLEEEEIVTLGGPPGGGK